MIRKLILILLITLLSPIAGAAAITSYLEMVKVASVGSNWVPVTLTNSYSNPIIACTYGLQSVSENEAVVRVQPVGTGFEIKLQRPIQGTDVTAGDVYCIISETGSYTYPIKYEANKVSSSGTNYSSDWTIPTMVNITTSKALTYTQPAVIGQVMTYNNAHFSTFWSNDCVDRRNPATNTGICVGKHTGKVTPNTPNPEDVGYIIAEEAEYFMENANIKIALGADSVAGVGDSPPYTYNLGRPYTLATASIAAINGSHGAWAVFYGSAPVSQNLILALDEETAVASRTRRHTEEPVSYWAMRPIDTSSPRANLIFNEVLYREGSGIDEFVELYATSGGSIENYVISGQNDISENIILPELTVAAGDYIVVHFGSGADSSSGNTHHIYTDGNTGLFHDAADDLVLFKPATLDFTVLSANTGVINGFPVDYIAYGAGGNIAAVPTSNAGVTVSWNAGDGARLSGAIAGQSISLTVNATDTNTSACWELTTSGDAIGACPNHIITADRDASAFINSQGEDNNFAPILALEKSVLTVYDPYNGASNPKAIPGSVLEYTITASNSGPVAADNNTINITDMIPAGTKLCVSNSGFCVPPYFVDGSPSSGLAIGTVVYSTNGGTSYSNSSSPDGDGVDTNITHLSAPTTGQFQPIIGGTASSFSLKFRVVVQ